MPPARLSAGHSPFCRLIAGAALGVAALAGLGMSDAAAQDSGSAWVPLVQEAAPIDKASDSILQIDSAGQLAALIDEEDFDLQAVREAKEPVPRLFVAELPPDLSARGKDMFVAALLPLLLHVNEEITRDRGRVIALQALVRQGGFLTMADRIWLTGLAERYRVDDLNFATLLDRVDVIPPSMALAQAAVETGWGTSNLARSRNALFGQMAPTSTYGALQYVHFDQLRDSAQAYVGSPGTELEFAL